MPIAAPGPASETRPRTTHTGGKFHRYPFWAPRFWHGMALGDWLPFLFRNRCAVHPYRWAMAFLVTLVTAFNSMMRLVQRILFGRRLARTRIEHPPIFIIGHWRSGTTYLHELFELDDRFTSPTTCQCFTPHHFLVTSWFVRRLKFLLPRNRPMDNVIAGWDRPQEDEFALVALGAPSPYLTMAFPNRPPQCQEYLDFAGVSAADRGQWQEKLLGFLKAVTCQANKPIVLKSPPHTGRIHVLAEMFPDARFIHIVRDPCVVFPSTIRLWKSLYETQAFQKARHRGLEELVLASFERMYASFERHRGALDPTRIIDVRYEDLVADPVGRLETIYSHLGLPDFAAVRPKIEAFAQSHADYQTNRYALDEATRAEIARRWGAFMERYGYLRGD